MATQKTVPILVFDVNETLLDITSLEPLFERLFGNRAVLREWFAQLILYSQSMTLAGLYSPFGELAVGTLRMLATIHEQPLGDSDIAELKTLMGSMPAHPDVVPALSRLRAAGLRMVTLSNSASAASPTPLERAGLGEFFEQSFSVEAVGQFKPAPETYQHVAQALGVATPDLCLIACHLWDTLGAQAAGCHAALLTRPGNALLPAAGVPAPELVAAELGSLAEQILQRWGA
ncbi:2-haloacid dehalogenase [Pseudomonas pohangensis]|uniref:(S)-2-haloacid dehalogenase n=1 Tax=Pseudomonas pohangensis TaxID=364197 RepID=A0A1H2EI96_9PSED|nr:haloacid dehalogenase type II [Pseudomonas pohangensis]SDT94847.1 2-haloacid dehalogenase [Pseudomonas pohangensis]